MLFNGLWFRRHTWLLHRVTHHRRGEWIIFTQTGGMVYNGTGKDYATCILLGAMANNDIDDVRRRYRHA